MKLELIVQTYPTYVYYSWWKDCDYLRESRWHFAGVKR